MARSVKVDLRIDGHELTQVIEKAVARLLQNADAYEDPRLPGSTSKALADALDSFRRDLPFTGLMHARIGQLFMSVADTMAELGYPGWESENPER